MNKWIDSAHFVPWYSHGDIDKKLKGFLGSYLGIDIYEVKQNE